MAVLLASLTYTSGCKGLLTALTVHIAKRSEGGTSHTILSRYKIFAWSFVNLTCIGQVRLPGLITVTFVIMFRWQQQQHHKQNSVALCFL
jgi:hypothetical protein